MTVEEMDELARDLAEKMTDSADLRDLVALYFDDKLSWLLDLSEDELQEIADDYELTKDWRE